MLDSISGMLDSISGRGIGQAPPMLLPPARHGASPVTLDAGCSAAAACYVYETTGREIVVVGRTDVRNDESVADPFAGELRRLRFLRPKEAGQRSWGKDLGACILRCDSCTSNG
eukprot:353376-Chlamydomonas_euryale.AAC.3